MGYNTDFSGRVEINPPLDEAERNFLEKFAGTRRMFRGKGPYYVDNTGMAGQDEEADSIDYNRPPAGQPGLWCQWVPTPDGKYIKWDGGEKFYNASEWMTYIIDHFLKANPIAKLPHLKPHTCNGEIKAAGEDPDDRWKLVVKDNKVSVKRGVVSYR
jgi:hypothetical protein